MLSLYTISLKNDRHHKVRKYIAEKMVSQEILQAMNWMILVKVNDI